MRHKVENRQGVDEKPPLERKEGRIQLWRVCSVEQEKGIGPARGRAASSVSLRKDSIRVRTFVQEISMAKKKECKTVLE